jgi:mRNA-degrading endonuclease RelE of RelBE toxin-antitoxin system
MYEIFISHEAEKYYKKQDADTKRRLNKCLDVLAVEPLTGVHVKRLHGELEGRLRYEMGGLRIIYKVNRNKKIVEIISIRGRGDIYKR